MKRLATAVLAGVLLLSPLTGCTKKERTPQEKAAGEEMFRQKAGGGPGAPGRGLTQPKKGPVQPEQPPAQPAAPEAPAGEAGK